MMARLCIVSVEQSKVGVWSLYACVCVSQADWWISCPMAEGEGSALTVW